MAQNNKTTALAVDLEVNRRKVTIWPKPHERLIDTLRDRLGLTGTKEGCSIGECGACTVILDGKGVCSCLILTGQVNGSRIETVEGLEMDGKLSNLQEAFINNGAIQCGFCTPGMLMSAKALLDRNPHPKRSDIVTAIEGNLCRCTGYEPIIRAIESVASE